MQSEANVIQVLRWFPLLLVAVVVAVLDSGCATAPQGIPAFSWPPPTASAQVEIPANWLPAKDGHTTLSAVASKLASALNLAEYRKWSYSSVPNGFALVAQMEQINPDGTPVPGSERWSTDLPSIRNLDLLAFVRALVSAPPGSYRVIVFIVTDVPWSQAGGKPTEGQAQEWLNAGVNKLPAYIGNLPYAADATATALVYEFKKSSRESEPAFVPVSAAPALQHLERAGIVRPLSR